MFIARTPNNSETPSGVRCPFGLVPHEKHVALLTGLASVIRATVYKHSVPNGLRD